MATPLISVLHPTRRVSPSEAFPSGCWEAIRAWISAADDPSRIEYVISVHESRWEEFWKHSGMAPVPEMAHTVVFGDALVDVEGVRGYGLASLLVVKNSGRDCAVDQVNCAAAASSGLLLIGAQDDLFPPEHWDTLAIEALGADTQRYLYAGSKQGGLGEVVIRCSSGSPRDKELTIAGFTSHSRYERIGYCLSPEFSSGICADDYFDWELRRDERAGLVTVIERQDIQFEHRHPIFGKGTMDESYGQQNAAANYRQGFATFKRLTEGTRVIACCFPGKEFGHWVASSISKLLRHLDRRGFIVEDYWAHTSNVYVTRIELADAVMGGGQLAGGGARPDLVYSQDHDNPVTPEQIDALIADLDGHPELDIVVGWCWCDTGDYEQQSFRMSCGRQGEALLCKSFTLEDIARAEQSGRPAITSDDIAPDAFWSGFPVVLMRAAALEKLGWQAFLPMLGNYKRGFTSEDTTFFYRAQQAGLKSAVDLRVKVPHLKVRAIEPYLSAKERQTILDAMGAKETPVPENRPADDLELSTCRQCKRSGPSLDEFTSPYTGLCAECSKDLEKRNASYHKTGSLEAVGSSAAD